MAEDLLTTIRPFLYYSQVFGLCPVKVTTERADVQRLRRWWPGTVYCLVLFCGLWFSLRSGYRVLDMIVTQHFGMNHVWKFTAMTFSPISTAMVMLSSTLSSGSFCDVINELTRHEFKSRRLFTGPHYLLKYGFLLLFLSCHVACLYYLYHENLIVFFPIGQPTPPFAKFEYLISSLAWGVFDVVSWPQILSISCLLYLIHRKFRLINAGLESTLVEYDRFKLRTDYHISAMRPRSHPCEHCISRDLITTITDKIVHIRQHHMLLTRISQDLTGVFSVKILIIISHNVVLLCITIFLFVATFLDQTKGRTLHTVMSWAIARFLQISFLVLPFTLVANEANRTLIIVHEALSKYVPLDMKEELWTFAMLLENRKLGFTVLKMFALKKSVLMSIIGLSATYIFVFIQFHIAVYPS